MKLIRQPKKIGSLISFSNPVLVSALLGFTIAVLFCFPFFHSGRLFLLDWVAGPNTPLVNGGFFGLNGGVTAGVAFTELMNILYICLGSMATWIPCFVFFPIATVAIGRLVNGSIFATIASGILYTVNPFVFNRFYAGHINLLIGYAIFPFAIKSLVKSIKDKKISWLPPSLWLTALTAISVHYFWIYGICIFSTLIIEIIGNHKRFLQLIKWTVSILGSFVLMNLYLLIPSYRLSMPIQLNSTSLNLYQTTSDPILGLLPNVLSFYGFWRLGPGPVLPKNLLPAWSLVMLLILSICFFAFSNLGLKDVFGLNNQNGSRKFKSKIIDRQLPSEPRLLAILSIIGFVGLFFALGVNGPTAFIYNWIFKEIPFFGIMRESQKFLILYILSTVVFFAIGVEKILFIIKSNTIKIILFVFIGVIVPLAYSCNFFNGLNGQIGLSSIPNSYLVANELMVHGGGSILYLPWHEYMSYPFTNNRTVANVAQTTFNLNVISGDNVQIGPIFTQSISRRSNFIEGLLSGANKNSFGNSLSYIGVHYIVLAKTVDWQNYAWMNKEKDLRLLFNSGAIQVFRNIRYKGQVQFFDSNISKKEHQLQSISSTQFFISPGHPGRLNIDIPYQYGWEFNGKLVKESEFGTISVYSGANGGVLNFKNASNYILSYILSVFFIIIFLANSIISNRKSKQFNKSE